MDFGIRIIGLTGRKTTRDENIDMAKFLASKLRSPENGIHTSHRLNVIRIKSETKTIDDLCEVFPSLNFADKTIDEPAISLNHKVAFCRATILKESE